MKMGLMKIGLKIAYFERGGRAFVLDSKSYLGFKNNDRRRT